MAIGAGAAEFESSAHWQVRGQIADCANSQQKAIFI
jgi:hypothetical protein